MVKSIKLDSGNYKGTYKVIGGALCFDFSNTISYRNRPKPHEWLDTIENFEAWCQIVKVLNSSEAELLRKEMDQNIDKASTKITFLKEFRDVIYRLFSSIVDNESPKNEDLKFLNELTKQRIGRREIKFDDGRFIFSHDNSLSFFERVVHEIYNATIHGLTQMDIKRIKKCTSCEWLFYDTSKNLSRKWCVMEDCGNRDKVNRFNKRKMNKTK